MENSHDGGYSLQGSDPLGSLTANSGNQEGLLADKLNLPSSAEYFSDDETNDNNEEKQHLLVNHSSADKCLRGRDSSCETELREVKVVRSRPRVVNKMAGVQGQANGPGRLGVETKTLSYGMPVAVAPPDALTLQNTLWIVGVTLVFVFGVSMFPLVILLHVMLVVVPWTVLAISSWVLSKGAIQPLNPLRAFSNAGDEMYTIVHIIRGECRLAAIREKFKYVADKNEESGSQAKLQFPTLKKRLVTKFGFGWLENIPEAKFKVSHHVKQLGEVSSEYRGEIAQSQLMGYLQDHFVPEHLKANNELPQWEVLVVPKMYYDMDEEVYSNDEISGDNYYALVYRANAALLDKHTALKIFYDEIAQNSGADFISEGSVKKFTKGQLLCVALLAILISPWMWLKSMFSRIPKSYAIHEVSSTGLDQRFLLTFSKSMSNEAIIKAKNSTSTSTGAIYASCAGGAYRNLILSQDLDLPPGFRVVLRPNVSLQGLQSVVNVWIPSRKLSYPLDRLADAFHALGGGAKLILEAEKWSKLVLLGATGFLPLIILRKVYRRLHNCNILLEVWQGALEPCILFGQDVLADFYAWNSISEPNADFGITVTSYAGRVKLNIISKCDLIGAKVRPNILAQEFLEEYVKIGQPCNIKPNDLFRNSPVTNDELSK